MGARAQNPVNPIMALFRRRSSSVRWLFLVSFTCSQEAARQKNFVQAGGAGGGGGPFKICNVRTAECDQYGLVSVLLAAAVRCVNRCMPVTLSCG